MLLHEFKLHEIQRIPLGKKVGYLDVKCNKHQTESIDHTNSAKYEKTSLYTRKLKQFLKTTRTNLQ